MNVDYNLGNRKWVIIGIMTVVVLIYLVRLFTLQVLDNDYKRFADSNAFLKKIQYPSRGLIMTGTVNYWSITNRHTML